MHKDITDIHLEKMLCNLHKAKIPVFDFHAENTLKARPVRTRRFVPICVTVACLLVISVVLYNAQKPSTTNSDIPLWYFPQKLEATTITYKSTSFELATYVNVDNEKIEKLLYAEDNNLLYKNIVVDYPANIQVKEIINAQILDISNGYNSSEHENCSGLYFDTKSKQFICLSHEIKAAMNLNSNIQISIDEYGANLDFVAYTLLPDQKSYYFNRSTGEYNELPVSLYGKSLDVHATKDYRYILTAKPKPDSFIDDVILIDTKDLSYSILSNDYSAYMYIRFSDNDQLVCFTVRNDDGSMPNEFTDNNWIVYNIKSRKYFQQHGDLIRFSQDDSVAIFKTADRFKAVNTVDGTQLSVKDAVSGLAKYIIYEKLGDSDYTRIIIRENMTDSSKTTITPKAINTYTTSSDGKYLYSYILGDSFIKCINIDTLESFDIPIGSEFAEQTVELAKDNRIIFNLSVNDTMTQTLLCYYIVLNDNPQKKPTVSESTPIPSEPQSWDFRGYTEQQTIDKFKNFYLTPCEPYFFNPSNTGFNIVKSDELMSLIKLLKTQKYHKMPLKGLGGGFNKIFWLSMNNEDPWMHDIIEIGQKDKDDYYIYCHGIDSYCYISQETYDELYEISSKLIEFPSPPVEKKIN